MASRTFIYALTLLTSCTTALQVTPNSPCASFCVDSDDLDFSDPNSSTTTNKDITCYDSKYSSSPAGQKFQSCITCLQESTFSQGSENDQLWFLYNLKYTFDYCVFGYPNATDIASTPCSTSTACGDLEAALTDGQLNANTQDYAYCAVDGGAMTGPVVSKCLSCVSASDDQEFLANYLIALETGCKQQPPAGTVVGLNDTVFSLTTISAIDPNSETASGHHGSTLSTPQVVGIVVGAIVTVLAIAGIWFVCGRKRRNRRLRLEGTNSRRSHHRPASSLSFRCQTHLSPRSPAFFPNPSDSTIEEEKKVYTTTNPALGSHPVSPESPMSRSSMWQSQLSTSGFKSYSRAENMSLSLHNITTTGPAVPSNVHYSTSPKAARFSPIDETPASTTSTWSTSQLLPLKPYNPAEYGVSSPHLGSGSAADVSTYTSPISGSTASPLLSRVWDQRAPTWELPPRGSSYTRPIVTSAFEGPGAAGAGKGKRVSNTGSPVESKQINTSFAGPPTRR
ncbi:Uu.00g087020.m01.CDS01 [Anthostomella pinea]|uniref:Uu.00g087020.m01.CDS01 n=1 Tax=Anthostomella pinea TaxID=933095 RepID=A0AAI8YJU3_9PEZI|nr:Uu.00g087020.m01.CDS01 [Anthostomella pinea]